MSGAGTPLVSADVDLRNFPFMPLDVLRLRDSDLASAPNAEVFRCSVLSWCVSWHQLPAASLPDDDVALARLLGFGRDVKGWIKVRADGGLRGWIRCDDGRLYHPVVAEKAREAWLSKLAQRARTEAARKAREEARQRQSQSLSQTEKTSVTETVTESKGQGQGQGQGQGLIEEPPTPRKRGTSVHGFPPGFDAFWSLYPRRENKAKAAQAFARIRPDEAQLAAILAGLRRQIASDQWRRDGGQFIPHPTTWLNGRRWEDEAGAPDLLAPVPQQRKADRLMAGNIAAAREFLAATGDD